MDSHFQNLAQQISTVPDTYVYGRVTALQGLLVECSGILHALSIGSRCTIWTRDNKKVPSEVVGFKDRIAMLMPYTSTDGIGIGCKVILETDDLAVYPHNAWLGRVVNAFGEPIDDKGPLLRGEHKYLLRNSPPPAHKRQKVQGKVDLGVRSINTFLTCCRGQRMGVFAGSGIGKSMLIAMLTRFSKADIKVIGLIGERGREVQEFIQDYLGHEGLEQAVIVVATSDESALMRKQAAYMTITIAEYFRDQGKDVLCLMDSITRFAMAQREIGLSAGEPPTSKGYTPTVFAELPKLLERAGPGIGKGSITGLFSVLVEGDDHNEPISDAVRAILDGHIVLDRAIAERGRFPAINVLRSVSRTMPHCNSPEENAIVDRARRLMATYEDMADMIRLGAYRKGSDASVDAAILYHDAMEDFLRQDPNEICDLASCYNQLRAILLAGEKKTQAPIKK